MAEDETKSNTEPGRRYTWPWVVLAAVLLAIALAILWMSYEVARTRMIRELNTPEPRTNEPSR